MIAPAVIGACSTADLDSHTVLYYKLEENGATPYVDEVKTANFTLGTVPARAAGVIDFGQSFDRGTSEYLRTPTGTFMENGAWSISMWVKGTLIDAQWGGFWSMIHQNGANYYGCYAQKRNTDNKMRVICYTGAGSASFTSITTNTINNNDLNHLVFSYTGSQLMIYINGTEAAYDTQDTGGTAAWDSGNHDFCIAGEYDCASRFWNGLMDEVAMYDTNLTQDCIDFLFNSGAPNSSQQYPTDAGGTPPASYLNVSVLDPADLYQSNTDLNVTFQADNYLNSTLNCTLHAQDNDMTVITDFKGPLRSCTDATCVNSSTTGMYFNDSFKLTLGAAVTTGRARFNTEAPADCSNADTIGVFLKHTNISNGYPGVGTLARFLVGHDSSNYKSMNTTYIYNTSGHLVNNTWRWVTIPISEMGTAGSVDMSILNWTQISVYGGTGSGQEVFYDRLTCFNSSEFFDSSTTNSSVSNHTISSMELTLDDDGNYSYWMECHANDIFNSTEPLRYYNYDTTEPSIIYYIPNLNYKPSYTSTFNLNISISDDDALYWTNISIINMSGSQMMSTGFNLSGLAQYTVNTQINHSGWTPGKYTVVTDAWDSHTAKYLPSADSVLIDDIDRSLTYDFGDNVIRVELYDGNKLGQFESIETVKLFDRYSFIINMKDDIPPQTEMIFRVTSSKGLQYIKESPFQAHFITKDLKYWIDFAGLKTAYYQVDKIDDYTFDVTLITKKEDSVFVFDSVGAMNHNQENRSFYKLTNVTVYLNNTVNNTYLSNFTVTASSEGLCYHSTTVHTDGNNSVLWICPNSTYSLNATKEDYLITPLSTLQMLFSPQTQTLQASQTGTALYFYHEENGSLMSGINIGVELIGTTGEKYTTNTGSQQIVGLNPGNYFALYGNDEYYIRSFPVTINDSIIQDINLYLLPTNDSGIVTFYIRNSEDRVLENISVIFMRQIQGNWTTVIHRYTDFAGSCQVNLYPFSRYYMVISDPKGIYSTKSAYIEPVLSTYSIYLLDSTESNFTTVWEDVNYQIGISNKTLDPLLTNFSFTVTAGNSNLAYFGLYADLNGTLYNMNVTTSPSGGIAWIQVPLQNFTGYNMNVSYYIKTTNPHTIESLLYYSIMNISASIGNHSLVQNMAQIGDEISERTKLLMAVFAALFSAVLFSAITPLRRYSPLAGIPVLAIASFPMIAWIPMWLTAFQGIVMTGFFFIYGDW